MLATSKLHTPPCRHAAFASSIAPYRARHCKTVRFLIITNSSTNGNGNGVDTTSVASTSGSSSKSTNPYNWTFDSSKPAKIDPKVQDIPVNAIRRPLGKTRSNDQAKVDALMKSIMEIGLQEPIDVLLVDGQYYGFSGCHRYEAHQRLGLPTIKCRVRKANKQVLKMHMM